MIAHSYFVLQNTICCCCCSGHHRGSSSRVGEVDVRGEGERAEQAEHRRGHEDSRLVLSTLRRDSGSKIFASNMLNTLSHWSNTDEQVKLDKFLPTQWKSDSLHFFFHLDDLGSDQERTTSSERDHLRGSNNWNCFQVTILIKAGTF